MFKSTLCSMGKVLCLASALASCATSATDDTAPATDVASQDVTTPLVRAPGGQYFGNKKNGVRSYLGIPYAEPPVGARRWQPPVAKADLGVVDATRFGAHCPQVASPFGVASTSEDCLSLNVYAPVDKLGDPFGGTPVIVWFHGGALVTGESDDYDPTRLVKEGEVIVVTVNYRLGALGFLAHPALVAESADHAAGNYGLMDQQEALRWVQRNIVAFGGDPSRVTIAGESAGGLSVHAHLANNNKDHLFAAAIIESGAYQLDTPTLSVAQNSGVQFAVRAGCTDQTAACLRGLSIEQILASQDSGLSGATPVVDGKFLKRPIRKAIENGKTVPVPVLEGSNGDEWRLFQAESILANGRVPAAAYPAAVAALIEASKSAGTHPRPADQMVQIYPLSAFASPDDALAQMSTDAIFACNALASINRLQGGVRWSYEFNDRDAPQRFLPPIDGFEYGAAHASELQYLFDLPTTVPAPAFTEAQKTLAKKMVQMWTAFAHTGNPRIEGQIPLWIPLPRGSQNLDTAPPSPLSASDLQGRHNCDAWGIETKICFPADPTCDFQQ